MPENRMIRSVRDAFHGRVYQSLAIVFCVLFGIAMIVNTQLGGEAEWFWYAQLLHNGAKLYADLHLALQPLYLLETNAWIQLFGTKCLVTEIPSVIHVFIFCVAIFLILKESDWPDWQKAIVLAGAFLISLQCTAYRFDDFHLMADTFVFYSLALLLMMAKTDATSRQFGLATGLGILSGLTITTRLNDGAAILVATGVCLLFLARKRKLLVACLFVIAAALTVVLVVKLTGDSFSDYASNSIFKAAGAKGGTHAMFTAPYRLFRNALRTRHGQGWLLPWILAIIAAGPLVQRYWKNGVKYLIWVQLGIAVVAAACLWAQHRLDLLMVTFAPTLSSFFLVVNYLLLPVVAVRFLMSRMPDSKFEWDPREVLILIPLAELASASASTAGTAVDGFLFSQISMLLLLVPVVQPFRRQATWANASIVTIMALMGISAMGAKIKDPYSWLVFRSSPMFVNRQWYHNSVYGPLYLDRDLLQFIEPVCRDIGQATPKPELLSIPYSYPNYFCDTPPWHGYVQTFFDTSTPVTINQLMGELDTAPPQWIVYQRQTQVLRIHEVALTHGLPLPHRHLDELIMKKIATGQWQVVQKSKYLFVNKLNKGIVDRGTYQEGDGWWIIRTR